MEFPWRFCSVGLEQCSGISVLFTPYSDNPVESLMANFLWLLLKHARSNVCYNGAYINFLILFFFITSEVINIPLWEEIFSANYKAMLSFMWSIYMEEKTLITAQNAIIVLWLLLGLDILIQFASKEWALPYGTTQLSLPCQIETLE